MFKILLRLSNILNITKENRGKNSGRTDAAVTAEGAGGSGLRPRRQWQWRRQPTAAMAGGKATVAEAEAARGQTTINQKAIAIAAVTVLVTAEMVAAIAVAAAMATVAMAAAAMAAAMVAPTGAEAAVDMGRRSSLVHLHNRSYRCDYNCFVYSEYTVFWFLAKHFLFSQNIKGICKA